MSLDTSSFTKGVGVLLHPSALPSDSVCGTFGSYARTWLKLLAKNNICVWQFLPLSRPDSAGSPYSSPSSYAFNTWLLDANDLFEEGFIQKSVFKDIFSFFYQCRRYSDHVCIRKYIYIR